MLFAMMSVFGILLMMGVLGLVGLVLVPVAFVGWHVLSFLLKTALSLIAGVLIVAMLLILL